MVLGIYVSAFGTREVDLNYKNLAIKKPLIKEGKVSIGNFDDEIQTNKERESLIGCVRNSYGQRTAEVISKNKPCEWFKDALMQELKNAGYTIVNNNSSQVNGTLTQLYTDTYMVYNTQIAFKISVDKNGKKVYIDAFNGTASHPTFFVTPKEYGNVSNEALENTLRTAIPKLVSELEKLAEEK